MEERRFDDDLVVFDRLIIARPSRSFGLLEENTYNFHASFGYEFV